MVRERRVAGKNTEGDDDVLDMLLSDELFQNDDLKVTMDIRGLFLAGDETCNVASANFIYYMAQHPQYLKKVIAETLPTLDKASSDFVNLLSPDVVDEFVYTKQCMYETMRMCPSGPTTMPSAFNQDVKIQGVDFKAHKTSFVVNMQAIMKEPTQWIRPNEFNPDRFDPKSEWFKRPDGKPRNPLAFCPFSGGKRICAGKTFAEIMLNITIPLIYYHFDFEFTSEEQRNNKPGYMIGAHRNPKMPFRVRQLRKVAF